MSHWLRNATNLVEDVLRKNGPTYLNNLPSGWGLRRVDDETLMLRIGRRHFRITVAEEEHD